MNTRCARCSAEIEVRLFHPRFPKGPFFCPDCEPKRPEHTWTTSNEGAEGEAGQAESDAPAALDEASADGFVASVKKSF